MTAARAGRLAVAAILIMGSSGCASGGLAELISRDPPETSEPEVSDEARLEKLVREARENVPPSPDLAQPGTTAGTEVWRRGLRESGLRVMVGTESRALWLMRDTVVLMRAPVAVGMEEGFTYNGKRYDFTTPIGRRKVQGKGTDPLWVPPDWHYFELAIERDLEVVQLRKGQHVRLGDDTRVEIRGDQVGRVNQFGNWWPFTPGSEIIFDRRIYIPPFGTKQRQIPEILGTRKLEMGDGYLIHGTNEETSVGDAVSHGCVRMFNEDVERLYELVPVGTPVYIF